MSFDEYRSDVLKVYGEDILKAWESYMRDTENCSPFRALALAKAQVHKFNERSTKIDAIHFNGSGFFNPVENNDASCGNSLQHE
jgi:hypothetical protein